MKFDHLNQWTPRIFFLLVIILSFHFIRDVKYKGTKLGYVLDKGLEYRFSGEEEWKPYSFKQYISTKPEDLKIWIRIPIPKVNPGSRFLFLRVIDGGSRFYFKGSEFYRSGIWSEDGKLIRFPNFFSHIIELPMEALGDVIEAEVYSNWKTVGIYLDIKLLTAGEIPLQFISNEMVYFVFAFFYLITGSGSLLIYIFIKDPLFKYLGYVALSLCGISLFEMNMNISSFLWFDFSPFILYNSYLFLGYSLARFIGFMFGGFFLNYLTYYSTFLLAMGLYGNTAIYHFGFTKYYPDFVEIPLGIGAALGVLSMLVFSIYKSYLGDRNARIFVASIFIFQLGLFDYLAFQFGLTNKLEPDLYLRFFPIIISLIIIMALRYQDTKNELLEYTRMLEESKSQLENRVKEKTLDLEILNNQLLKTLDYKSEFLANVTHEFKTPLTLILTPIEKLYEFKQDEESVFLLDLIQKNANRIQDLVEDLLATTKMEHGFFIHKTERIVLNEYFKQIIEEFQILCEQKNIQFVFNPDSEIWSSLVEKSAWDSIFRNILSNAVKFTNAGKVVFFYRIDPNQKTIHCEIQDSGIGITETEKDKIWEQFYQSERNKETNSTGTGIGLYLAKQLVTHLDGSIQVDSLVNLGTNFKIQLPCPNLEKGNMVSEESRKFRKFKEVRSSSSPRLALVQNDGRELQSILVVDDEIHIQEYLEYLLSEHFKVTVARDVKEALKKLEEDSFDLILSDWSMPGKTGIAILEEVHRKKIHIPFLFLTAYSNPERKSLALQAGADDFIEKPFQNEDLIARIKNKIQKSKSATLRMEDEKDSVYSNIHDILGGKLTDLQLRLHKILEANPIEQKTIPRDDLKPILEITNSLLQELRRKLHDWEDFQNIGNDFELACFSMLVRRYSNAERKMELILSQNTKWEDTDSWKIEKKKDLFLVFQEIANNDLKYGFGKSEWKIEEFSPNLSIAIKTFSRYEEKNLKGRGNRDLQTRAERLGASLVTEKKGKEFTIRIDKN